MKKRKNNIRGVSVSLGISVKRNLHLEDMGYAFKMAIRLDRRLRNRLLHTWFPRRLVNETLNAHSNCVKIHDRTHMVNLDLNNNCRRRGRAFLNAVNSLLHFKIKPTQIKNSDLFKNVENSCNGENLCVIQPTTRNPDLL